MLGDTLRNSPFLFEVASQSHVESLLENWVTHPLLMMCHGKCFNPLCQLGIRSRCSSSFITFIKCLTLLPLLAATNNNLYHAQSPRSVESCRLHVLLTPQDWFACIQTLIQISEARFETQFPVARPPNLLAFGPYDLVLPPLPLIASHGLPNVCFKKRRMKRRGLMRLRRNHGPGL